MSTEAKPFSFYEVLPNGKTVFFIDATLLKNLSLCERYFYLHNVENKRPKSHLKVKPFPMAIGAWWSDVMELFYNYMRDRRVINLQDIQQFALTAWAKNNLDDCMLADPDRFAQFGDIAGSVLMLHDYFASQYQIDDKNWQIIGVEEGFGLNKEVFIGESNEVIVYWVGRPDLVVLENRERLFPVDHKTVSRIDGSTTGRYKPSTQMPGYVYSTEVIAKSLGYSYKVDRCVVNICSRSRPSDNPKKGPKRPRFVRAYPTFNKDEIEEWKRGVISKCERIAHCLKYNDWLWSETSCDNIYMRQCDFKKMDSSVPNARDIVLAADFTTVEPWKPYQLIKEKEADD